MSATHPFLRLARATRIGRTSRGLALVFIGAFCGTLLSPTAGAQSLPASCTGAPSGQESVLSGRWAVMMQGWQGTAPGSPEAAVLSFDASGTGSFADVSGGSGITGNVDSNNGASGADSVFSGNILTAGSSYNVGLDPTNGTGFVGCMTLASSDESVIVLRFALSVTGATPVQAAQGRVIQWTDTSGTGTGSRTSGVMLPQDATAFSGGTLANLHSNYAFGEDGTDPTGEHFAEVGTVALNTGTGQFSGTYDANEAGTTVANQTLGGVIAAPSSTTGRAVITNTSQGTAEIAMYIVNANEFFIVGIDPVTTSDIYSGRAIVTGTSFSTSTSLSGNYVLTATGNSSGECGNTICADVDLGVVNFSNGALTGTIENYTQGTAVIFENPASETTYSVVPSGRVTVSTGSPVLYLATPQSNTEQITAFLIAISSTADFGEISVGANSNVATSSMAGNYIFGTPDPGDSSDKDQVGVASINSSGSVTGYQYKSVTSGLSDGALDIGSSSSTVTITNSPLPGFGNIGSAVVVTDGARFWFFDPGTSNTAAAQINAVQPAAPATGEIAPAITSVNNATFTVGANGTFIVATTGNPVPALTETGTLPNNVTFTDNGNGTATIAGVPAIGTANSYPISITANNEITPNAVQSFTLTVVAAPVPPTISKAFNVVTLPLNGSTTLSFTINNPNASTMLTGVGFTDTFPAGLVVSSAGNGLNGSCGSGTITAVAGSGSVSLAGGTVAASGSCTFSVTVTATGAGTINNTTGNVTATGVASGTVSNTASLMVLAPPTVSQLSANSGPIGSSIVITGTNFGTTQAQGPSTVTVNGVSVGTVTNPNWSPTSITVTVPAGATGTGNVVVTVLGAASATSESTSFTVTQSAGVQPSATALASAPNPSVLGQTVIFTAPVDGSTSGTPTGTVTFFDGTNSLGTGSISNGQATFSTAALTVGSHSIKAVYGGSASFSGSTSNVVIQVVDPTTIPTTTPTFVTLSSSPNPSSVSASVLFTATVSPVGGSTSGTPTGTVNFLANGTSIGTSQLNGNGVATLTTSFANAGSQSITAEYFGDSNFATSNSGLLTQIVGSGSQAVSVQITPYPTTVASCLVSCTPLQFTATVLNAGTNTGVTWNQLSGPGTLNTSTGEYTPPSSASSTAAVTITATSVADPTKVAAVTFLIAADGLTSSATPATVSSGGSTPPLAITLTGIPTTGANSTVPFTLSCSNLPVGSTCVFNPPTVTGANPNFTVTVVTSGTSTAHLPPLPIQFGSPWYALFGLILPALAMAGRRRRVTLDRRSYACCALLVLMCVSVAFLSSCGASTSVSVPIPPVATVTPSGSYQVVVTATPGANSAGFVQTQLIVPITVN